MTSVLVLIHSVQDKVAETGDDSEEEEEGEEEGDCGKCWKEVFRIVAEGPAQGTRRPSSSQPVGRR